MNAFEPPSEIDPRQAPLSVIVQWIMAPAVGLFVTALVSAVAFAAAGVFAALAWVQA